jgi:AcrR family transcriptional regulator
MSKHLSPLKQQRRDRLLSAAQDYFLAHGLRAATMEGIAAAAGLSKVTLYGYFPDRDAVFAAVVARLLDQVEQAALTALSQPADPATRLTACLLAKHGLLAGLLARSPAAADLMAAGHALAATRAMDQRIITAMASVLGDDHRAQILFHAATGVAAASTDLPHDIGLLVTAMTTVRPPAPRPVAGPR